MRVRPLNAVKTSLQPAIMHIRRDSESERDNKELLTMITHLKRTHTHTHTNTTERERVGEAGENKGIVLKSTHAASSSTLTFLLSIS